jgi:hypothetical protein
VGGLGKLTPAAPRGEVVRAPQGLVEPDLLAVVLGNGSLANSSTAVSMGRRGRRFGSQRRGGSR